MACCDWYLQVVILEFGEEDIGFACRHEVVDFEKFETVPVRKNSSDGGIEAVLTVGDVYGCVLR